jgi:hypothetical protein
MAEQVAEAPVRYRFTSVPQGVQLEIWELAPSHIEADKPFLFRAKYLLPNRQEAETVLADFLRNNGLAFADDILPPDLETGYQRLLHSRDTRS